MGEASVHLKQPTKLFVKGLTMLNLKSNVKINNFGTANSSLWIYTENQCISICNRGLCLAHSMEKDGVCLGAC